MLYAAKSHIGLVRQSNEDGFAVRSEFQPLKLVVVADGMGGASAGEVASKMAVDSVCRFVEVKLPGYDGDQTELLREAVYVANREVWQASQNTEDYEGMGTTLVAALFDQSKVIFANVGDSRGYLFQSNQLKQITRDHSLVAELVRRGQLTEEEALHHPQRNIVTRSLGTSASSHPDVAVVNWQEGDVLLLCTDGLTNLVKTGELQETLKGLPSAATPKDLEKAADGLIELALDRGGQDNITLILVLHREGDKGEW